MATHLDFMKKRRNRMGVRVAAWRLCRFILFAIGAAYSLLLAQVAFEEQINKQSTEMAQHISSAGLRTIAIVDFTDLRGQVTELGRFLAEEFSATLAGIGTGFNVVDRIHLRTLLSEHKLSETGIINPATVKKLGQIAGVDAVVTGTITEFGDSVRISAKILHTETAKIIGATRGSIPKTEAIKNLLEADIAATAPASRSPRSRGTSEQTTESNRLIVSAEGYDFELRACAIRGGQLLCAFLITNTQQDRELYLGKGSRVFDNLGNEFGADRLFLGNSENLNIAGGVQHLLVSNVPTRAAITFNGVPQSTSVLSLITVSAGSDRKWFELQWRSIPVSK